MEDLMHDTGLLVNVISGKATTAISRRLYRDFRAKGITVTPAQWVVLQVLSVQEGMSQQELANITFKDKPSMTRMLDNMEKHALIARLVDHSDKRSNLIHLTKQGRKKHQEALEVVLAAMKEALRGLDEQEIQHALTTLKKIYNNLL